MSSMTNVEIICKEKKKRNEQSIRLVNSLCQNGSCTHVEVLEMHLE